jgi:hypothetical protein
MFDTTSAYQLCQLVEDSSMTRLMTIGQGRRLLQLCYNETNARYRKRRNLEPILRGINQTAKLHHYVNCLMVHWWETMQIEVKCYSGYLYAEEPRSFVWEQNEYGIKSIEKAWQEPGSRLFRVVTEDGRIFELCYNQAFDRWSAVELTSK